MKEPFFKKFLALGILAALSQFAIAQNAGLTTNNAPVVTVTASDPSASEIGPDTGTFTVFRTGATSNSLTVFVRLGGTASNGVDYETISNTVTIPAGEPGARVTVTPIPDGLVEGNESVILSIVPSPLATILPQYQIGSPSSALVTIADGTVRTNVQPVVNIYATDPDATEIPDVPPGIEIAQQIDPAVFTVTRSGGTGLALVVYYRIGGTASNGVDYQTLPGTVTIPEGAVSALIEVDPIDDLLVEGTETVVLEIVPPVCAAIFPPPPDCYLVGRDNRAVAYIHDNEVTTNVPPEVNIFTPAEGATFTAPANILIAANARDVDDAVSTVEFFADDHSLGVRTNYPVANVLGPFVVYWTNVPVGAYTLTALATDARGASTRSAPVHVSVVETNRITNLPPIVTIEAIDAIAAEGTNFWYWPVCTAAGVWQTNVSPTSISGTNMLPRVNTATFKVRRTGETNADLIVSYAIGGTASNGVDYETLSGQVTIPAGQHAARITVVPIDDTIVEPIETVVLELQPQPSATADTPPPYLVGIPRRAAAIIVDNDSPRPPCMTTSDGLFCLCRPGTNGFCFRLEVSTNLVNWVPVCTNSVTDGAIHYVDPDATDSVIRFYRTSPAPCPPAD